ncbi:MAG: 2-succinyl-5-enolpyruvyl-6-hydroxy-3-cyclohexene-1-carboxylic-acid synthase [Sulfobacillus sp.]
MAGADHPALTALADALAAGGVETVCLAPGSRSGPLALALSRHNGLEVSVHLDERSMGFFALGRAKASRTPVVILTTSGTAAANLMPAVVEAAHGQVPLIVLTADRPPEAQGVGAPQTISQTRLFGDQVLGTWEIFADALADAAQSLFPAYITARALAVAQGAPMGPVHINLPLREPLFATAKVSAQTSPQLLWGSATTAPTRPTVGAAEARLAGRRGLVVAGPLPAHVDGRPLLHLAKTLGWPILVDPLSQLRTGPGQGASRIAHYDLFLRDQEVRQRLRPEVLLMAGQAPISAALLRTLGEWQDVPRVWLADPATWPDPALGQGLVVPGQLALAAAALAGRIRQRSESGWSERWQMADQAAWQEVLRASQGPLSELSTVLTLRAALGAGRPLVVGNSMPIRDLDATWPVGGRLVEIFANRGASGIDGVTSTALGVASGGTHPTLLIGDLSFLHDQSALLTARRLGLPLRVVLIHNDGGGIFSMLPQVAAPEFETVFGTPHGQSFQELVVAWGGSWQQVSTRPGLRQALTRSPASRGVDVIEVRSERRANLFGHQALWQEAGGRALAAIREVRGRV